MELPHADHMCCYARYLLCRLVEGASSDDVLSGGLRGASLTLHRTRVQRPVVLLIVDGVGESVACKETLSIALVRCRVCGRRWRLLPADVLPHKQYGLAVIAAIASAHTEGNRSLRDAAWTTHTGQTPGHSTVHAWTEGLGAHVLGRPFGSQPAASSFGETLATTTARWPALQHTALPRPQIDPRRHRSEARRERLVAVAGILQLAAIVLATITATPTVRGSGAAALCEWRRLAIAYGVTAPFAFRTGITCTPIEHSVGGDRQSSGLPQPNGDPPCPTRTRSPPGDSNRSPPTSIPPSTSPAGEA